MGTKRSADDVVPTTTRPRRQNLKRIKISPPEDDTRDSSEPSSGSISEDSALRSSPRPSDRSRDSSMSSLPQSVVEEDGSESSVSSTSSESSDPESDSEVDVTTVGGPKKPSISREGLSAGAQDIRSRLAALLPRIAEANGLLVEGAEDYSLEDVGDDEQHIEMNLGLGVLERKAEGQESSSDSDSSDDEELEADAPRSLEGVKRARQTGEVDVLGRLMGQSRKRPKVGIQEAE